MPPFLKLSVSESNAPTSRCATQQIQPYQNIRKHYSAWATTTWINTHERSGRLVVAATCDSQVLSRYGLFPFEMPTDLRTGIRKTIEHLRRQSTSTANSLAPIENANWTLQTAGV